MNFFQITPVDQQLKNQLQQKINQKTKPLGALGVLEDVALQIGLIQQSLSPRLTNPHILVFAGDHGIAQAGVSVYPQEVTWQMVMNFLTGGAAINVFCRQHAIRLFVVDAGVNYTFSENLDGLIRAKIKKGTANFLSEPAMPLEVADICLHTGAQLVNDIHAEGCTIIGFGEMGIGNTSSASIITSLICKVPIDHCTGQGTGLNLDGVKRKITLLTQAIQRHGMLTDPLAILATYGGFEIAQMVGAMLQAATQKMIILVDGFIATAAFLIAHAIQPAIRDYALFCHRSGEGGHSLALKYLGVSPLLDLGMRLGEGTGAAVAYPIIQSAVSFLNEMASFDSAGVSHLS